MQDPDKQIADEVKELKARGIHAATEFFERDRQRLRLFVKHRTDERLLGRLDWDDVLQESFIVVQGRFSDFVARPSVPFYVWIRSLTGQVLIDLHRKHLGTKMRSVQREVSLRERLPFQSTSNALGSFLVASGLSPSRAAMRAEQLELMRETLQSMNDMDREVLLLRHMEQMTNGEVAAALGIDKSAATKRYIRALKRIRQQLEVDGSA